MGKDTVAKIGLGVVTTGERQEFLLTALASIAEHVAGHLDWFSVHVDSKRKGVAKAKNKLLRGMMDAGCTYLFLMEDDVEIVDSKALAIYVAAYRLSGVPHLNFSQHGANRTTTFYAPAGPITYWPNGCGAFSFYTRSVIEEHGYMDEHFYNAYEHVEHSWRIYKGKLAYGLWPDVTGSDEYVKEQPGAIDYSTNGDPNSPERIKQINKAREYWFAKDPECPLVPGVM